MKKLNLGNSPTKIEYLEDISKELGNDLYIKREDFLGLEMSGNKTRKLEYSLAEVLELGKDTVITTGGPQSNHCRITAALCNRLNLDCHILYTSSGEEEGNYFFTKFLGAKRHFVEEEDFEKSLKNLEKSLESEGKKTYFIPTGASNGIGSHGYLDVYREILEQEKELSLTFDRIVVTVGSGGTTAGLLAGSLLEDKKKITAYSIWQEKEEIRETIQNILKEMDIDFSEEELEEILTVENAYGEGYSLSTAEEISFIQDFSKKTGIILDPTYTGKAMKAFLEDLKKGCYQNEKILFIHTGGIFGWRQDQRDLWKED